MFYVYFVDNFGRTSLDLTTKDKNEVTEITKKELSCLDPDTNRYILITTKKLNTYEVKE